MSNRLLLTVCGIVGLRPAEWSVLLALARGAGNDARCQHSNAELAAYAHLSKRHTISLLHSLVARGYAERLTQGRGRSSKSQYQLNPTFLERHTVAGTITRSRRERSGVQKGALTAHFQACDAVTLTNGALNKFTNAQAKVVAREIRSAVDAEESKVGGRSAGQYDFGRDPSVLQSGAGAQIAVSPSTQILWPRR